VRMPPDTKAKCEVCGKRLNYEIGSIQWQAKDNDFCGFLKCIKPECRISNFRSRCCEHGTEGCVVEHNNQRTQNDR
jgi:hypothetical protein